MIEQIIELEFWIDSLKQTVWTDSQNFIVS